VRELGAQLGQSVPKLHPSAGPRRRRRAFERFADTPIVGVGCGERLLARGQLRLGECEDCLRWSGS
jgi:hypothetical protein